MRQPDHEYEERSFGDIQRAIDFENSMNDLESQLYYQHLSPKEVAQQVLKATCQFYDADWCGLIQVDLDLNIPTSIQSSKDIYVSLFGELSISTSKGVLKEADFSSPSINRLISYLLISRKNAISPQEITQTLWPDDSDNPAKNVKGLVYRLRQKFSIISDEPLVLSSASGYQLNPELHIMTDYQRFDELVSSAVRASSVINKVDILKNALDLYHGKVLSSADGEHWLIQFSTKYHLSYMGAVSELLKQLDSLHSYDLLNQYAMKSLTIAPDNPKAYCWLIRSLKAQGMNELATNELAAAKEHLTTEEYEEILAFGANW